MRVVEEIYFIGWEIIIEEPAGSGAISAGGKKIVTTGKKLLTDDGSHHIAHSQVKSLFSIIISR